MVGRLRLPFKYYYVVKGSCHVSPFTIHFIHAGREPNVNNQGYHRLELIVKPKGMTE